MEVEYKTRFGTLVMKTVQLDKGPRIHVLFRQKKLDGEEELLPYHAELPVPDVSNVEEWMHLTLVDNAERFFRMFTFVGVPCPHCNEPLPVMIRPFTEMNYCVNCGGKLP